MNETSMALLADRFFAAVEKVDLPAIEDIYASDAVVWHGYDDVAQSRRDNIRVIASFPILFETFKYCDIRRRFFEGGFVQQHVLRGTTKAGSPFALFACMIITMNDGQISRIDEYFDTAQVPPSAASPR